MKTKRQIKNFVLKTLLPYKKDKSLCALNENKIGCFYLTKDGKKCAVGRWLKKGKWQESTQFAEGLFIENFGKEILLKEARDMNFTVKQWRLLQKYHDMVALGSDDNSINGIVRQIEKEFDIELSELKFNN